MELLSTKETGAKSSSERSMRMSNKDMAMIGIFSALSVVMGYAFIHVPNIEMISASIFISGYLLGIQKGILVAIIAETTYSAFNPMGSGLAFPYLLVAQILGMSLFGAVGGILGSRREKQRFSKVRIALIGTAGLGCTLFYDMLTTLSWPLAAGFEWSQVYATIALGSVFTLIHIISNTLIFVLALPPILRAVKKTGRFG